MDFGYISNEAQRTLGGGHLGIITPDIVRSLGEGMDYMEGPLADERLVRHVVPRAPVQLGEVQLLNIAISTWALVGAAAGLGGAAGGFAASRGRGALLGGIGGMAGGLLGVLAVGMLNKPSVTP